MTGRSIQDTLTQPYTLEGGTTGILMIHGFAGIPAEMRPLSEFLVEQGYTVHGVLLAQHGQKPEALRGVRWQDWYASVEEGWQYLIQRCEQVVVIGFSLGGLLALQLAAQQPVAGVITLAAALQIAGGWPLRTLPVARYLVRWYYPLQYNDLKNPAVRANLAERVGDLDFDDPSVVAQLRTSSRIPTGAIYEIVRLGQHVRRNLARITAPALVLQGQRDTVVLPLSAERILNGLGSSDRQLAWFERSGHQLASDVEREQVFQTMSTWLVERVPVHEAQTSVEA